MNKLERASLTDNDIKSFSGEDCLPFAPWKDFSPSPPGTSSHSVSVSFPGPFTFLLILKIRLESSGAGHPQCARIAVWLERFFSDARGQ